MSYKFIISAKVKLNVDIVNSETEINFHSCSRTCPGSVVGRGFV